MPYVSLNTFESFFDSVIRGDRNQLGTIRIRITYDIVVNPVINDKDKIVEIVFYTI
jgi:hypothetical protein